MEFTRVDLVHRIVIVDDGNLPATLPEAIQENIKSATQIYPSAEQKVWCSDDLRSFIRSAFGEDVVWAYDLLKPFAYKSDLARYCLLYHFGGMYADLGVRLTSPMEIPKEKGVISFRDFNNIASPSWTTLSQSLMWARAGRAEFRIAIEMVVENCRRLFYGTNPLYPTGPVLLGRAFVIHLASQELGGASDDQWIGARVPPNDFICPDGRVVACSTKRLDKGGDLTHLGMTGTNNYNNFWARRMVYGEVGTNSWPARAPHLKALHGRYREDRGIEFTTDTTGVVSYGPYIYVEAGSYRLVLYFEEVEISSSMMIEIFSSETIETFNIAPPRRSGSYVCDFYTTFKTSRDNVEFRLFSSGRNSGLLTKIDFIRL